MRKFEKLHIYRYPNNFLTFYCRFIDDIFFLWNGTESALIQFIDNLNQKHPTIKFEFTYSRTNITFLDTKVYKMKMEHCARQALRIKRMISKTSEIIKHLKDLKNAFIKKAVTNLKF